MVNDHMISDINHWKTLIVDDEEEILLHLKGRLTKEGLKIDTAKTFAEAIALINKNKYHLAILDIFLPDGNGIDLFQALKQKNSDLYTIMITGSATVENAVTALNEGINSYLVKPFSEEQLNASIHQANKVLLLKSQNKKLFQTIESNRQFYENLLNSTSEAIVVVDLEYRIRYCNNTAATLLQPEDLQTSENYVFDYFEDGYKIISHIYHQLVEGHSINGYQVTLKNIDDTKSDVQLSADFLYDKNGEIDGLIIKISNPLILNEGMNRAIRKERLSTIVNLANTLSHVIRNPINILSGRLQLIKNELRDHSYQKAFESIDRQIERIIIITELLGKFNFIKEDTIPEKCNISDILKKAIAEIQDEFIQNNIPLQTKINEKNIWVEGNQYLYADAFKYLLNSLIKFVPSGNIVRIAEKENFAMEELGWYEIHISIPGIKLSTNELFESFHLSEGEESEFMELELALMQTIFNNYHIKIDSIIQNNQQTLIRIHFPDISNNSSKKSKQISES